MRLRLRFRLFLLRKKSASIAFWYQNAACFDEVVARAVRVSQPAVLSALLI